MFDLPTKDLVVFGERVNDTTEELRFHQYGVKLKHQRH